MLGQRHFDLAVIDEACQSTEPGCWIPLLRCRRVVLAGDHCQLPPTVLSRGGRGRRVSASACWSGWSRLRPAGDAAAGRAVPHARGDHGVFVARVLRRRAGADPAVRGHLLRDCRACGQGR